MKTPALFTLILILIIHTFELRAGDVYVEYKMKGMGDKISSNAMYFKNGDMRTEMKMEVNGKQMTSVSLNLKSNPDFLITYNTMSTTYTEIKRGKGTGKPSDFTITVLGNEKIGKYDCKHVRMTSDSSSWEMWITPDLPHFEFPLQNNDEAANRKFVETLKSKSITGVPVKVVFFKHNSETPVMTMELEKYENKDLDASLFRIPDGYTKSEVQFDAEKMKAMTPEERKAMIQKMMEQNMQKH